MRTCAHQLSFIVVVVMDFTNVKTFPLKDTEVVFDSDFHPDKEGVLAVATIEGNVHVYVYDLLYVLLTNGHVDAV